MIFVTSTIKGEGKTFVAFNLALTLALTGKKVALVGADIRNPQLQRYLPKESQSRKGLTEFIIDPSLEIKDLAARSRYNENLDIVLSGIIPPNPAELLLQQRTTDFFTEIKDSYDYVVVDTAPSMLVTDTTIISHFADITLYVIRSCYTEKKLLNFSKEAIEENKLKNVSLVLNAVDLNSFGYGNKYGYTYTTEVKKSFFKRIFNS
jgi:capsular exopolysaccharide synthesis family protein